MRTIELFSGTKSFSKVMRDHGHETLTIDNDISLSPDYLADILELDFKGFPIALKPDIIWASPPCQGFSVAAIGKNWNKDNTPKTDSARLAIRLAQKTLEVIKDAYQKHYLRKYSNKCPSRAIFLSTPYY